jgi:hypothetical protein
MANFGNASQSSYTQASFSMRVGKREITISRDFRKRFYQVNRIVDFSVGDQAGYLEVLVFGKWLIILSKARQNYLAAAI